MAQNDQISVQLTESEMTEIRGAIAVLKRTLQPKLQVLSPQDRRELPKMGERTVSFVQKCLDYSQLHGDLSPAYLDRAAFAVDMAALDSLHAIDRELAPLVEALGDSLLLSGSEAYQAALVFYSSVRNAAKLRVPAAALVYDDLSSRFPGAPTKKPLAAAKA